MLSDYPAASTPNVLVNVKIGTFWGRSITQRFVYFTPIESFKAYCMTLVFASHRIIRSQVESLSSGNWGFGILYLVRNVNRLNVKKVDL